MSCIRRSAVTLFDSIAACGSVLILVSIVAKTIAAEARDDGGAMVLVMAVVRRWILLCGSGIASHA